MMPFKTVREHRCFYVDEGSGDAVVLVHGYTGCWDDWATAVPALKKKYRCVALDQRGFGKTDHPQPPSEYTMSEYVEDIVGLVKQLGIERFHLAGVSMGGMIVQEFALAHQQMLLSLALVDTAPERPEVMKTVLSPDDAEEFLKTHTLAELWDYNQAKIAEELRLAFPALTPEQIEAARRRYVTNNSPGGVIGAGRMIRNWRGVRGRLGEIKVRTLVVVGELDVRFVQPSKDLAELIPNARLVIIPKCGHVPMFDTPETFNRIYMEFLGES